MKSILHTLLGMGGWFRQLPVATQVASTILVALVVTLGALNIPTSNNTVQITTSQSQTVAIPTQTVGAESEAFATFASWPGEIISPNDADVQPPRNGTIISWDVVTSAVLFDVGKFRTPRVTTSAVRIPDATCVAIGSCRNPLGKLRSCAPFAGISRHLLRGWACRIQ